jgi:hypothetical protein
MRPLTVLAVTFALLPAGGARAYAGEPDPATRAATTLSAVQLADEAGELYHAGRFAEALDRYERADALVRRHTIGLRIARCLARLGRMNEAAERYGAVVRMALPADLAPEKQALQKEAIAQAESEREALRLRIPGVIVELAGPPGAIVTIDGQRLPAALIGVRRAIDPGTHHIEARSGAGTEVVTRDVVLHEAEVVSVSLDLRGPGAAPAVPLGDPARTRRAMGFAGIGAGAAGIGVWIVSGALALAKNSVLQQPGSCGPELKCPSRLSADADTYNTERDVSSVGLIAGGVLAAAGVVLVLTAPRPEPSRTYGVFAGPTGGGVRGAF